MFVKYLGQLNFNRFIGYLAKIKWFVALPCLLFFIAAIAGYIAQGMGNSFAEDLIYTFHEQTSSYQGLNIFQLALAVFMNNLRATLLMFVTGFTIIIPTIGILSNGFLVGAVVNMGYQEFGILRIIVGLVPHGVTELTAVFISAGMGIRLGFISVMTLIRKIGFQKYLEEIVDMSVTYTFIVIPLVVISALIETFITSVLLYILFQH